MTHLLIARRVMEKHVLPLAGAGWPYVAKMLFQGIASSFVSDRNFLLL